MVLTIKQSVSLASAAIPEDTVQTPSLPSSLPSSPSSPKIKRSSSSASIVPAVANIFGKIRRGANAMSPIHVHGRRLSSSSQSSTHSSSDGETEREIVDSKTPIPKTRNTTWTCSSGPAQSNVDPKMKRIDCKDHFICAGGVTLPVLLRATRAMLIETIEGQNGMGMGFRGGKRVILTNEEWSCTISGPPPLSPSSPPLSSVPLPPSSPPSTPRKARRSSATGPANRKYKVRIHYIAYATIAATSTTMSAICGQPAALDKASEGSVRGLMTILNRREPDFW